MDADGGFTYTPAANYNGPDSFTYQANDGTANSNLATVTLTVSSVNDAPVAVADSYSTNEDTPLMVAAPGLLANDSDVGRQRADGGQGGEPGPRHGDGERQRQLHLHADGQLQRARQLHLPGERRHGELGDGDGDAHGQRRQRRCRSRASQSRSLNEDALARNRAGRAPTWTAIR